MNGVSSYALQIEISMNPQAISELIKSGLPDADVVVIGDDGVHFEARVVSEAFAGKSLVQQHQLVYKALGDKMGTDIHALSFKTYTPTEWEKHQESNNL